MIYTFTIPGRIKPYVRMTQRGKWVRKDAKEYLRSKQAAVRQLQAQMVEKGLRILPGQTRLWVEIKIAPALHNRDLDNEAKAVLDAMNGVVFPDDRWVDVLTAARGDMNGEEGITVRVGVL